jgi:hypothetical protein
MGRVPALRAALVVALSACGRIEFDPLADGSAVQDIASDTASACGFTFCDDFDRAGPPDNGWDAVMNTGGAAFALDTAEVVTAPQSLLVTLPATELHDGMLVKQLGMATTSARVKLAFSYASADPSTAEIDLVRLRWEMPPAPCTNFGMFLVRDSVVPFQLQETYSNCGGNENTLFDNLDNTGFHTVEMFVTLGPIGTAHVRVLIDGVMRVDKDTSHALPASNLSLQIGGSAVRDMMAPWSIRYDDVIVDLQ